MHMNELLATLIKKLEDQCSKVSIVPSFKNFKKERGGGLSKNDDEKIEGGIQPSKNLW